MEEVIANMNEEVRRVYTMNWIIPSIKNQIEEQAVKNVQRVWKSQIIGHFTITEDTDGCGYWEQHYGYDRYKNIYQASLCKDEPKIVYKKLIGTKFYELIYNDETEYLSPQPNNISVIFNTAVIDYYEDDDLIMDLWVPFNEVPVQVETDLSDIQQFRLECINLARQYNII